MKKILVWSLVLVMIFSLCACGEKESAAEDPPEQELQTPEPAPAPEPEPKPEPKPEPEPEPEPELPTLDATALLLHYDPADGWQHDPEEDLSAGEDCGEITVYQMDEDDFFAGIITVTYESNSAYWYRKEISRSDLDLRKLVEEQAYEMKTVGGVDCVVIRDGDDQLLLGRNERAGANLTIEVEIDDPGQVDAAMVDRLLEGVELCIPDSTEVDPPLPWEGEAFETEAVHTAELGGRTITSTWLPFAEPFVTYEVFDHALEVVGEDNWILSEGVLRCFREDGGVLREESALKLEEEAVSMQAAPDGSLVLSAFGAPLRRVRNGTELTVLSEDPEEFVLAPDGTWGLSYFLSGECQRFPVTAEGVGEPEPLLLENLENLSFLTLDGEHLYAGGRHTETKRFNLFVYDHGGRLQLALDVPEEDTIGSLTFGGRLPGGYVALDGNMRKIFFWDDRGTYLGALSDGALFGTTYPWFSSGKILPDGSLLVLLSEERADESATELLVYRVTGF